MRGGAERCNLIDERMADESDIQAESVEQFRFEREEADQLIDVGGDFRDTVPMPRPDLRADVVHGADSEGLGLFCEAQIHSRVVDGQEQIRLTVDQQCDKFFEEFGEETESFEHLPETDDTGLRRMCKQFHAFFAHTIAADSEEGDGRIRQLSPQLAHECGAVEIARDFTCANHDLEVSGSGWRGGGAG